MNDNQLVHQTTMKISNNEYLVEVFSRPDGSHFARTVFSAEDVIINDGLSLEDALARHESLLPLAIRSRQMPLRQQTLS